MFLMDDTGKCAYLEKTMREPVDAQNPVWDLRTHSFNMHNTQARIWEVKQ